MVDLFSHFLPASLQLFLHYSTRSLPFSSFRTSRCHSTKPCMVFCSEHSHWQSSSSSSYVFPPSRSLILNGRQLPPCHDCSPPLAVRSDHGTYTIHARGLFRSRQRQERNRLANEMDLLYQYSLVRTRIAIGRVRTYEYVVAWYC